MGAKLTVQQKEIIHRLFVKIDTSKDGKLSVREVADRFQIPYDKAFEFVSRNDKNNDQLLDEEEFARVVEKHVISSFKKFDKDNTGTISLQEANDAIAHLHIKGLDAQAFMQRLDKTKDGQVTFEDWLNGLFVELAVNEKSVLD